MDTNSAKKNVSVCAISVETRKQNETTRKIILLDVVTLPPALPVAGADVVAEPIVSLLSIVGKKERN